MQNTETKKLTKEEYSQARRRLTDLVAPFRKHCPAGLKAAMQTPKPDWWITKKVQWCAEMVELHRAIGDKVASRNRYNDLRFLIATSPIAMAELKRLGKYADLVKEGEAADQIAS